MKIAHILPYSIVFPLVAPNGRYSWVLQLAESQVRNGHDVTIYCHPNSHIEGIRTLGIHSASTDKDENNRATFRLALKNEHDIYHSHFDNLHYELSRETAKPIVYTQHWWPVETTLDLAKMNAGNVWAVPPTRHMYEFDSRSGIQSKGFIYHGVDLELFQGLKVPKNNRLLFVSRIAPDKNPSLAIEAALKSNSGLDIIGKITEKNRLLWDNLQPMIDGEQIRYLGTKDHRELARYYSSAKALLFPSSINEAFGLVAIEAQACGTPVIMMRGGSRNELIDEGHTGYLCESVDDLVEAIHNVDSLRSEDCVRFAQRFDRRDMEKKYELLYEEIVASQSS